jgi:hypothetical protein
MKSISSSTSSVMSRGSSPWRQAAHGSFRLGVLAAALTTCGASQAIDFGPDGMFSLTGFGQVTIGQHDSRCFMTLPQYNNQPTDCQWFDPLGGKQLSWTEAYAPNQPIKTVTTVAYQVQPWLGAKFDLGKGYKLSGLLSQRWRDNTVDGQVPYSYRTSKENLPGFWFEKNIALSHEDYGRLTVGHMTARSWHETDYPYGGNVGLSEAWSGSGAGYGMLTSAVRYQFRNIDFFEGDLVLEATYDMGNTNFSKNKPRFIELYGKYYRGPLEVDVILQDTKNGGPSAFGLSPFTAQSQNTSDDAWLDETGQSVAIVMARYWVNKQLELSGGLRRNSWSGASAKYNKTTGALIQSSIFNVDWNTTNADGSSPGYSATSYDLMLGARYSMGKWTPSLGLVHLGTASTDNPYDHGQGNSALLGVLGLQYNHGNGVVVDIQGGAVHYARLGQSPMSMPGNTSFTGVDSRFSQDGRWFTVAMTYTF